MKGMPVTRAWEPAAPEAASEDRAAVAEAAIDDRVPHADLAADPALAKWLDHATEVARVVTEEKAEALGARGAQVLASVARGNSEGEWTGSGGEESAKGRKAAPARRFHLAPAEEPLWQNLVEDASADVLNNAFAAARASAESATTASAASAGAAPAAARSTSAHPKKHTALIITGIAVVLGAGAFFYGERIADTIKRLGDRVG